MEKEPMRLVILITLLLCVGFSASADSPARAAPYVVSSGAVYFTMVPIENAAYLPGLRHGDGIGTAYRLNADGSSTKLWLVKGWYAFETYISIDGHYLVRMGDWANGAEASSDDPAIYFYADGNLLKQYSTADLIKDPKNVIPTASHYFWRGYGSEKPSIRYNGRFNLTTTEDITYVFDIGTGDIIEEKASPAGERP